MNVPTPEQERARSKAKARPRGKRRSFSVEILTRVEGEGALDVKIKDGVVSHVGLRIYEPPRFFEALLRGRAHTDAPDITARICGICPVAYQMSSVHAIERAFGVAVGGALRDLRRLLYCGEWIESHALHVVLLHAPDFLGYPSGIHMAKDHPEAVTRGLEIKKVGNALVALLGGREIHPVGARVGGFHRVPTRRELEGLVPALERARERSLELVRWTARLPFPELERDYLFVALRHPEEYPLNEGRIVSSAGHDLDVADYEKHFEEVHVERSNALHSVLRDHAAYHVGPLARYALNFDRLSPAAQEAALEAGLGPVVRNPFKSIVVRAVETLWAVEEALRLIARYEEPEQPFVPHDTRAGVGWGATEAPRGLLYHRYRLGLHGRILDAKIVPPTAQNQRILEADVRRFIEQNLTLDDESLRHGCEQAVRNYDPCISCATHFLRLDVERE